MIKSIRDPMARFIYNLKINVSKKMHAVERTKELFAKAFGYDIKIIGLIMELTAPLNRISLNGPKPLTRQKTSFLPASLGTTWRRSKLWPNNHWKI